MKSLKLIVKIGLGVVVCGIIFSAVGFFMGGKFSNINNNLVSIGSKNVKTISQTKQLGNFDKVDIDVDLDYVEIIKSNENKLELNYDEKSNKVESEIKDNNLKITQAKNKHIGIHVDVVGADDKNLNYLKLYVSDTTKLKDLKINAHSLDVKINSINSENTNIKSASGDIDIDNLASNNCTLESDNGDVNISNSNLNNFVSNLQHGDFKVLNSNSKKAEIKNSHGDVNSTGLSSNELNVEGTNGDINMDGSLLGITTLKTKNGSIYVTSNENENLYNYNVNSASGDINIGGNKVENSFVKENNAKNTLNINSSNGDINVKFAK